MVHRLEISLPTVKRMCKLLPKLRHHHRNKEEEGKHLEKENVVPIVLIAESTGYLPGTVLNSETALPFFYLFFSF